MMRTTRPWLSTMCVLVAFASVARAAADPPPAIIELRRHLVDGNINTLTFRSIDQMFDTRRVDTAGKASALTEAPAALDFSYEFEGKPIPAAEFAERTFTNALIILRDDRIVFERYFNNTGRDTHFLSMS